MTVAAAVATADLPQIGLKFRAYPMPEQASLLKRTIGCARLVYNKGLGASNDAYKLTGKSLGYLAQSAALTEWKTREDLAFLNEVSSVPLQQSLRHLQKARANFFAKRAKYPSFKPKKRGGSCEFTRSAFRYDVATRTLTLAKMSAPLDVRWSRELPPGVQPTTVTVSLDAAGRWFVSLLCEDARIVALPPALDGDGSDIAVGLDVGITTFVTLSTGEKIPNPRFEERDAPRRKLLQKRLARKKKGSKNREKARLKLARHNAHTADCRRDHTHKLSTRLVRENQTIVVENLRIKNMVRNHRLARAISDVAWGELFRQLEYKSKWRGRNYIKTKPFHPSSKLCSTPNCGYILAELPLSVRQWTCPRCGVTHDRDVNAARNTLAAGLAVSACVLDVSQHDPPPGGT